MNFNSNQFAAVVENAKAKAANHPEWLRAIEKAASLLESGELCVTLLSGYALVTSPRGSYKVNGVCECAARTAHCYHRAAKRLVEMLETAPVDKTPTMVGEISTARADIITDIKAAWTRRFPGESLADELMRRFKKNKLEMLSVDFLTAIRAAIA